MRIVRSLVVMICLTGLATAQNNVSERLRVDAHAKDGKDARVDEEEPIRALGHVTRSFGDAERRPLDDHGVRRARQRDALAPEVPLVRHDVRAYGRVSSPRRLSRW